MAYTKNIAVIRELKSGFSADGGALTGLVKVERYGAKLKAEASLINFAPLTEGRYVIAVSDVGSVNWTKLFPKKKITRNAALTKIWSGLRFTV